MRIAPACSLIGLLLAGANVCLGQMGPASVLVAPVESRVIELTQPLVASVEPVMRSTLAAEEPGLVAERLFDEGQHVEKGQVLVRGDVALVDALGTAAQARLKSAEARLREAQVNHDVAERERLRIEGLYHTGVVSEKESNDATAEGLRTAASVDARSAEAAEEQAELARLSIILKKAEVRSPFAGVVTARYVEVGQWVKQGDPIAEIVQLDPLYVRVQVPEAIIARVRTGDQAKVTIDAVGGDELIGKVDQVIPEADRASRTFAVRILLPNPERRIWPGFFGRAVLTASSAGPQLVVPRDAVVSNGTAHHVVVVRGGTAALVPVSMGVRLDSGVAVQGGLQAGEVVVIRGNEALRGGEALVVLNPVQAPADAASAGASTPASQPAPGG